MTSLCREGAPMTSLRAHRKLPAAPRARQGTGGVIREAVHRPASGDNERRIDAM